MTNVLRTVLSEVRGRILDAHREVEPADCLIIAHVHVLPSIALLFHRLLELGFRNDAIFIIPKPYSTIERARARLEALEINVADDRHFRFSLGHYDKSAARLIARQCSAAAAQAGVLKSRRIILVDDGGLLSKRWEADFAGRLGLPTVSVQQTASGAWRPQREFPHLRIDVARSAAKRLFESRIIAEGVLTSVRERREWARMDRVGVIGVGALGSRLTAALVQAGKTVFTYDQDRGRAVVGAEAMPDLASLLSESRFVFGCSGRDAIDPGLRLKRVVHLASCSSRDVEFQRLLQRGGPHRGNFRRVFAHAPGAPPYIIENGGFPINFDRQYEWEDHSQIALTRALVLLGILQATTGESVRNSRRFDVLDPHGQQVLVRHWLKANGANAADFGVDAQDFEDLHWWQRQSSGRVALPPPIVQPQIDADPIALQPPATDDDENEEADGQAESRFQDLDAAHKLSA